MNGLLQNAVFGTALILAAALLHRGLKGRLPPEARLALWAVCLLRLLSPVFPDSGLSLWGLLPRTPAPMPNGAAGYLPTGNVPTPGTANPGVVPVEPAGAGFPWGTVLLCVWIGVGLALAARYALRWNRTRQAVAGAIPLPRDDRRYAPLPKCARLREGVMDAAPLTFGAVRPTVVLSPGLSGTALECVLIHEGVHARRRDNLWHYAMAAALIVYWWNPAVWWMARLLRRDIELSCDRAAVRKLGAEKRAVYAETLVALATTGAEPAFCQTFGRKAAEERIVSVMKYKKTTVVGVVLSLVLVAGVTVAFASAPKAETEAPVDEPTIAEPAAPVGPADVTEPTEVPENPATVPIVAEPAEEKDIEEEQAAECEIPEFVPDYDPEVEDSIPEAPVADDQPDQELCGLPTAPTTNCGVAGCTETRLHQHQGDQCIVLGLICPVEGCTIPVCHDHDGVTYYCNGAAHPGGVCDGSCRGWSLTVWNGADTTPAAAPVSSGHHGDSHHGNGYHGGHH